MIISIVKNNLPHYKTLVIQNLKYEEYKILISKAKWVITFGEGLDFYFIEPVFSGGVSFALYNEEFFTTDFKNVETIYPSFKVLSNSIINKIKELDNEICYSRLQKQQFDLCAKQYSYKQYQENIKQFYLGNYTFK